MGIHEFYDQRGVYGVAPGKESRTFVTARYRLGRTLQMIQAQAPRHVLDIGCGDGFFSQRIADAVHAPVSAIDISSEAIEQARARGIDARQCDLNLGKIPFDAESFDLVLCGEVIEHVFDPDQLLDEIHRILLPGGFLLLSTPNLAAWYNRVLLLLGVQPIFSDTSTRKTYGRRLRILGEGSQPVGHLRLYTLGALKSILRASRFRCREVHAIPFLPHPVLRQIDALFGLIPSLGSDFLVLAQKQ